MFIAARIDEQLRQFGSSQTGLKLNGQWTRMNCGTIGMYVDDVTKLIDRNNHILRKIGAFGDDCYWIVISGSPCQDLTYAGPHQGFFSVVGRRSVFFVSQQIIWWISRSMTALALFLTSVEQLSASDVVSLVSSSRNQCMRLAMKLSKPLHPPSTEPNSLVTFR